MEIELSDLNKRFDLITVADNPQLALSKTILAKITKESSGFRTPKALKAILKEMKSPGPLPLRTACMEIIEKELATKNNKHDYVTREFLIILYENLKNEQPVHQAIQEASIRYHKEADQKKLSFIGCVTLLIKT